MARFKSLLVVVAIVVSLSQEVIAESPSSERRMEAAVTRYENLRQRHPSGLAGEIKLARWCEQRGLDEQSRKHWLLALCFDAKNKRALKALKLEVLFEPSDGDAPTTLQQAESLAMLSAEQTPAANFVLVWHALNSPFSTVRIRAIKELSDKPEKDYVPLLLTSLSMPLEMGIQSQVIGNRVVNHYTVEREGPNNTVAQSTFSSTRGVRAPKLVGTLERVAVDRGVPARMEETACGTLHIPAYIDSTTLGFNVRYDMNPVFRSQLSRANLQAGQDAVLARAQLNQLNQLILRRNEQVAGVLRQMTGADLDAYPRTWWKWWQERSRDQPLNPPVDR